VIGRNLTNVNEGKNAAEAQFWSAAGQLRHRGNRVIRVGPGVIGHNALDATFDEVVERWRILCFQIVRTTLVSSGNFLVAPVIGWVLCAPKYLEGTMSLGEVAQAVSAFVIVQSALNWLVDNYPGMAECLSSINRVTSLIVALDEVADDEKIRQIPQTQTD